MTDTERSVTVSRRELGVIAGLTEQHEAVTVSIREQHLDVLDAYFSMRDGRVRSYVVTLYGPSSGEYAGNSPTPLQFLLISGPGLDDGTIDVVLLTNRATSASVSA